MIDRIELQKSVDELTMYRRALAFTGAIYFIWWAAIEFFVPNSFNPLFGRLLVVSFIYAVLGFSYLNPRIKFRLRTLFVVCLWVITAHFFYLFYGNAGNINWVVGCYIIVIAISFGIFSSNDLLLYSGFVFLLSLSMIIWFHDLRHSIFVPGLATILLQANIGLRSRLAVIKNLADINDRFQRVLDSTFEGVLVHQNSKVLNLNDSIVKMFGYSRNEMIGRHVLDIIHPNERARVIENMKLVDSNRFETKGFTKLGQEVDIELRSKDYVYENLSVKLLTIQDISDRKIAENEQIKSLALAENVRVRDEFISIASHELKTPLSAVRLQVQIIARDAKNDILKSYSAEKVNKFLEMFIRQVDRLTELIETMLDVSRISAGQLTLEKQSVDIVKLIRDVAKSLLIQYEDLNYAENLVIEAPELLLVTIDPDRIEQVVENLLTNAFKYGDRKKIKVRVYMEGSDVVLKIEDQGIGIAAEYLTRIFERYERAIGSRKITGLGLGLFIARQIVEAHGGTISAESKLKQGSVFTVRLPNSN